jgi:hypothetical protein
MKRLNSFYASFFSTLIEIEERKNMKNENLKTKKNNGNEHKWLLPLFEEIW